MKFYYSASVMGYGNGRHWHKYYNFPKLPLVTKTLTIKPKIGLPFAIIKKNNSIWNRVSMHNIGFYNWAIKYYLNWPKDMQENTILSIAGTDQEIKKMIDFFKFLPIKGIELNFSCPNIKSFENKIIPDTDIPIYLKLNYKQNPYYYKGIDGVKSIRLNSIPKYFGGLSGKYAKPYNWGFIYNYNNQNFNISGCSITSIDDVKRLENIGCKEIGIGSIIMTNPILTKMILEKHLEVI